MGDYTERIARLQAQLKQEGADLAVLAGTDQMRYLTGWREGGHERFVGLLVPATGEPAFVVPSMNAPQAQQTPAGLRRVLGWDDATGWHEPVKTLLAGWGIGDGAVALIDDELHSVHLLDLQTLYPHLQARAIGTTMSRLREIKTDAELASMQRAAELIDTIFEEIVTTLRDGMTELDLQSEIHVALKRHDTQPSFTPTVCFGANSALPHHHTGASCLQRGDVIVIDIGCLSDNYASDITRTVAFHTPSDPDAARVYEIVNAAHWAARAVARPGVSGETVDAAARKVITEAGYGPQFMHRTGHGIGLSTHEPPYIVQGNGESLLPGMCFSVEPGVYLAGRFGVRIENIVTMTSEGARSLNVDAPRQLRILE